MTAVGSTGDAAARGFAGADAHATPGGCARQAAESGIAVGAAEQVLVGGPLDTGAQRYDFVSGRELTGVVVAGDGGPSTLPETLREGLAPPRFCGTCGRRMVVQVRPDGWWARCSRHGTVDSSDLDLR